MYSRGVGQRHSEPSEAGVHLDVDRGGPTGRRSGRRCRPGALEVVDGWHEIMLEEEREGCGKRAPEHHDRQVDARVADRERILDAARRKGEGVAVIGEDPRDGRRTVTVGVRLEGGDVLDFRTRDRAQGAHVVAQGREVELGPVRSDGFQLLLLSGVSDVAAGPSAAALVVQHTPGRLSPTPARRFFRHGRSGILRR